MIILLQTNINIWLYLHIDSQVNTGGFRYNQNHLNKLLRKKRKNKSLVFNQIGGRFHAKNNILTTTENLNWFREPIATHVPLFLTKRKILLLKQDNRLFIYKMKHCVNLSEDLAQSEVCNLVGRFINMMRKITTTPTNSLLPTTMHFLYKCKRMMTAKLR